MHIIEQFLFSSLIPHQYSSGYQSKKEEVKARRVFSWLWTRTGVSWLFLGTTFPLCGLGPKSWPMKWEPLPGAPLQSGSYKLPKADSLFIPHQPAEWSWLPGQGSAHGRESVFLVSSGVESLYVYFLCTWKPPFMGKVRFYCKKTLKYWDYFNS